MNTTNVLEEAHICHAHSVTLLHAKLQSHIYFVTKQVAQQVDKHPNMLAMFTNPSGNIGRNPVMWSLYDILLAVKAHSSSRH